MKNVKWLVREKNSNSAPKPRSLHIITHCWPCQMQSICERGSCMQLGATCSRSTHRRGHGSLSTSRCSQMARGDTNGAAPQPPQVGVLPQATRYAGSKWGLHMHRGSLMLHGESTTSSERSTSCLCGEIK